jgi:hypothetical protein
LIENSFIDEEKLKEHAQEGTVDIYMKKIVDSSEYKEAIEQIKSLSIE